MACKCADHYLAANDTGQSTTAVLGEQKNPAIADGVAGVLG